MHFLSENLWISLKNSLKFVPKVRINNIPPLVQIMAWHRPGDKPLSEPMVTSSLTHMCVTRPQWVNKLLSTNIEFYVELSVSVLAQMSIYRDFAEDVIVRSQYRHYTNGPYVSINWLAPDDPHKLSEISTMQPFYGAITNSPQRYEIKCHLNIMIVCQARGVVGSRSLRILYQNTTARTR